MLDLTTTKGKIIAAAMKLAATHKWADVTLRMISEEASVSMSDMKREASSKAHIFGLFTAEVDKTVLAQVPPLDRSQSTRDNLFETIMNRFDAMQPYKAGIKSIIADAAPDPRLLQRLFSSQSWMLEAAGISSYGPLGSVRIAGLASIYMQVVRIWLEDDDPGMARTMAALDRRLRRGERSIQALTDGVRAVGRFKDMLEGCRGKRKQESDASSSSVKKYEDDMFDGAQEA